jgi:glutaconate CoA-transferase subunit A
MPLAPTTSLTEAIATIPDAASVALGRPGAMALVREVVRQGKRDLHLIGVPTGGLAIELLIAAGAARSLETSGVDLGEHGFAPAFTRAVERGALDLRDSTCPALLSAIQAGAAGVSFAPVPGLIGTDVQCRRPDFTIVDDPYRPGQRVVLVPAIVPQFALLHGRRADADGNVVLGIEYDDRLVARAAAQVIVSVEQLDSGVCTDLAADEQLLPAAYVDHLVLAPADSRPTDDVESIRAYLDEAGASRGQDAVLHR